MNMLLCMLVILYVAVVNSSDCFINAYQNGSDFHSSCKKGISTLLYMYFMISTS